MSIYKYDNPTSRDFKTYSINNVRLLQAKARHFTYIILGFSLAIQIRFLDGVRCLSWMRFLYMWQHIVTEKDDINCYHIIIRYLNNEPFCKLPAAYFAGMWFVAGVNSHVSGQMSIGQQHPATNGTLFFASVSLVVSFVETKSGRMHKLSATYVAL